MIYINNIILTDFQSHHKSILNLVNGINAIIGENNSGKSSIYRAIRYALLNSPKRGIDAFVRIDKANFSVDIQTSKGRIKRTKGTKNRYLIKNGEKLLDLNRIGISPSEEIVQELKEVSGIFPAKIDEATEVDLSFSDALDAPFLIFEQGVAAGRIFSKLASLQEIDDLTSGLQEDKKKESSDLSRYKIEITSIKEKLKDFGDVEQQEKKLASAKIGLNRLKSIDERGRKLALLQERIERNNESIGKIRIRESIEIEWKIAHNFLKRLIWLEQAGQELASIEKELAKPSLIVVDSYGIQQTANRYLKLEKLQRQIEELEEELSNLEIEEACEAEKEYQELLRELPFCPLCKRSYDEKDICSIGHEFFS